MVLYFIISYYITLYFDILLCIILHYFFIFFDMSWYDMILYYELFCFTILYSIKLGFIDLYFISAYCMILSFVYYVILRFIASSSPVKIHFLGYPAILRLQLKRKRFGTTSVLPGARRRASILVQQHFSADARVFLDYPQVIEQFAIENGPCIVYLLIKDGDVL